ncbi:MAG: DUF805 domain-containing protein [Pseudomonadota bacterium]
MGPAQATSTCLRKAFTPSGRASRSEFWWFACVCAGVVLLAAILEEFLIEWLLARERAEGLAYGREWRTSANWLSSVHPLIWASLAAVAFPLHAAGSRRLHDIGAPRVLVLLPAGVLAVGYLRTLLDGPRNSELAGLGWAITIFALFCLVSAGLAVLLMLRAQPGANRYGRNPHEVSR